MIVIDASAIVAFLLREPRHVIIENCLRQEEIHSVAFVLTECVSAILRASRRAYITEKEAHAILEVLEEMQPITTYHSSRKHILKAFQGAQKFGGSVYDWLYLKLAEELKAAFLSMDQKIKGHARKLGVETIINDEFSEH